MGISWSRDPQGFQHTLAKYLASWHMAGEGEIYLCEHNMVRCVDIYWQYNVWRDYHIPFLGLVGSRI